MFEVEKKNDFGENRYIEAHWNGRKVEV